MLLRWLTEHPDHARGLTFVAAAEQGGTGQKQFLGPLEDLVSATTS